MNFKVVYNILEHVVFIILILLFCKYFFKSLYRIIPDSIIPYEGDDYLYSFEYFDKDTSLRMFDLFSEKMLHDHLCIDGEDIKECNNNCFIFKNFSCKLKEIKDNDRIDKCTLLFIFPNNVKWNHNSYFLDVEQDKCYFPKGNSVLYSTHDLIFKSDQKIYVLVGSYYVPP